MIKTFHSIQYWFERALHSPFGFQLLSLCFLVFFVMSFRPATFIASPEMFGFIGWSEDARDFPLIEPGFLRNDSGRSTAGREQITIVDKDGNEIVITQPKKRTKTVQYTIRSGDSITKVAHKFGLKVSTLLWANDLTSKETLSVGKEIRVPPTDGVFYTIKKGDIIGEVAKAHEIDTKKILAYNGIANPRKLSVGKEIFIPSGQRSIVASRPTIRPTIPGVIQPAGEIKSLTSIGRFRRPTQGTITQGYHRKHYALDIASRLNTPIYASASGTVKTSTDGWNYGYGKYVVVDHGNGVETLYSHLNARKAAVGARVEAGQLVGLMGNTGNVFGPTGIHLHFEIRINGRKVNPLNYF